YDNANDLVRQGLLGDIKFIRASWHRNNSFPDRDSWVKKVPEDDKKKLQDVVSQYGFDSLEQLVNWRLYNKTGGGLMAELGSHQMDAASIFLGKVHPLAVMGYGGRNVSPVKGVGSKDKQAEHTPHRDHADGKPEFP